MSRLFAVVPILVLATAAVVAGPLDDPKPKPTKGPADAALAQVRVEKGLSVSVWATEPLLLNPVAFCFDEKGRAYVVETHRLHAGVTDTRSHMYWLDDDIACRTVADRLAMQEKKYPGHKPYTGFENSSDRVVMVWDSAGSGHADKSSVFSTGYNKPADGLAAGVLARKGNVYFTNIPSLYRLRDTKGTNSADQRDVLSSGYGVRVQFLGHDLHGLRMGPDGKLYFSIGDRGLNVVNKENRRLFVPDTGSVLRCDLDGSNLEVVHSGLRNPQELAFDDFGNLFTYDNNSDSGDRARWVYIVEGGDSGWRCGYQYGTLYHHAGVTPSGNRGPWNTEKIWHVPGPGEEPPAYIVPPLLHFGNGPSGITHYPGIGLGDRYQDHFFCSDFTAGAGNSAIWSLGVKPKGASFEVVDLHKFVQGMVPTDCEFGPDGAFYWTDWVGGWEMPRKGRIFRLTDPVAMKNPAVAEAKKLIADGFERKRAGELLKLLEFPQQQVRLEAQFELAARAAKNNPELPAATIVKQLGAVAGQAKNRLARLHAIWAMGIIGRQGHPGATGPLRDLLADADSEVRAQAVKALGWVPPGADAGVLRGRLAQAMADPEPRVRFFAAQSYGKLGKVKKQSDPAAPAAVVGKSDPEFLPLLKLLKANNDADVYLRHAAVNALADISSQPCAVLAAWKAAGKEYDTAAVRLGVVLALRRLHCPEIAQFLDLSDPRAATEAARAIHDERITKAMPALAALADKSGLADPISYRALSACYHIGTREAAARVAAYAGRPGEPNHVRVFALKLLADWADPPRRDPITGLTLSLDKRPREMARDALRPVIGAVFGGPDAVRQEAARVAAKIELKEVGPQLAAIVRASTQPVSARVDALLGLAALKDPATKELTAFAVSSDQPRLRAAGRALLAKANPAAVLKELPALLASADVSIPEKQGAFAILATAKESPEVDKLLAKWLDSAAAGKVPPELLLDVLDATTVRANTPKLRLNAPLKAKLDAFRAQQQKTASAAKGGKLAPWAESLAGGDPEQGRNLVLNNSAVYCVRCHKLDNQGGEVGPALNGIAAQPGKDRRYLLESVVYPSANIAKGYETAVLVLVDGRTVSGIVKESSKDKVKLLTPENKELVIPTDDIESRRTGPSAMPDDLHKKLTRRELRDVVEFLASLKEPEPRRSP